MANEPPDMQSALQLLIKTGYFKQDIPADIDTALPKHVAQVLGTTEAGLAQMRYRGTGPRFVKAGKKVIYRWSDVRDYLDANTIQRTDDPRGAGIA